MMLEKKTKRELAIEFMDDFMREGTSKDKDDFFIKQESLIQWIEKNWACCGCGLCMREEDAIKELESERMMKSELEFLKSFFFDFEGRVANNLTRNEILFKLEKRIKELMKYEKESKTIY